MGFSLVRPEMQNPSHSGLRTSAKLEREGRLIKKLLELTAGAANPSDLRTNNSGASDSELRQQKLI